jgi:hypothetical protein
MSTSDYYKNAVALGDLKSAAVYFEHVVPIYAAIEYALSMAHKEGGKAKEWDILREKVLGDLLPPTLLYKPGFLDALAKVNGETFTMFKKLAIQQFSFPPKIEGLSQEQYDDVEIDTAHAYFSFIREFGLSNWPLVAEGESTSAGLPETEGEQLLPLLTLSRLNLVDASRMSWEHVYELRKDQVAQDKLRRLRLFAFQNYTGKSRDFIEDDLLARISDYELSARKWGLETVQGALSLVLNSKLAAGALAGSFVSAVFGQPVAALVAGTVGVVLEVSNVALEIQKKRLAIESLSHENPVSYISYARKCLNERDAR